MQESPTELQLLQDVLDRSHRESGRHIRSMFTEQSRISAAELVSALPGIFEIHLAVTTSDGAPMVAPVDAALFRGRIWFGLPVYSVRSRLVRRDGRVSGSYKNRDQIEGGYHGWIDPRRMFAKDGF